MSTGRDVETLKERARTAGRALAARRERAKWAVTKARELPARFKQLEREVQETQRLHQRVAELTDVVAEVLVPAADRDDERLRAALAKYNETSF